MLLLFVIVLVLCSVVLLCCFVACFVAFIDISLLGFLLWERARKCPLCQWREA